MTQQVGYAETAPPGFQSRSVDATGVRVGIWERGGSGPGLLFIHGNSASKAAFRDVLESPALAAHRIVAMDLPGCGESSNADDAHYTIPAMARLVGELIKLLGLDRPAVIGWSLGGHIALEAVGTDPLVCGALVLTGTPPSGPGGEELLATFHASPLMAVVIGESPPAELLETYVRALYGQTRPIPPELLAAGRRCDGRMRRVFGEHWMSAVEGVPQRRIIKEWPGPIAVLQGDQEPFFDPHLLDSLEWRNLWRGSVQYIRGAGHAPFLEKPAEFAGCLSAFLRDIKS